MANLEFIQPRALPTMTLSGSNTAAGFNINNAANDYAGIIYRSAGGLAGVVIFLDFGVDVAIDRLMMFGLSGAPAGATVRVLTSTNAQGATYTGWISPITPLYAGTQRLVNGKGVCFTPLTNAGGPPPSRYWRIDLGSLANAQVDIARIVLGKAFIPQRNFSFGGNFGLKEFGKTEFSARGNLLRTRRARKLRTVNLSMPMAYRDEIEDFILPMLEAIGTDAPVAIVMDPAAAANIQRRCYFGMLSGNLDAVWRNARAWEWRAELTSLF